MSQPPEYKDIEEVAAFLKSLIRSKQTPYLVRVDKISDSSLQIEFSGTGKLIFLLDFKDGYPPDHAPKIMLMTRLLHPKMGAKRRVTLDDMGIKVVGYYTMLRIIRALHGAFLRPPHKPQREKCKNPDEVKDVQDAELFHLRRGDCWDINKLVELILGNDFHNFDLPVMQVATGSPKVRLWADDTQLADIVAHPRIQRELQLKLVQKGLHAGLMFSPDFPIDPDDHQRQLHALAMLTLALHPVKLTPPNMEKIDLRPTDELKEIVLKHSPRIEKLYTWGPLQARFLDRWTLLAFLLENGFEDIKEHGKVVSAFSDEERMVHRKLITHLIVTKPEYYVPELVKYLHYCPTGIYDGYRELIKPLIEGGTPIEIVSELVEEAKDTAVRAITSRYVDRGLDTHNVKGVIKVVNVQYGKEPEVFVSYSGDPYYNRIANGETIKRHFVELWPEILMDHVVTPFLTRLNEIKYPTDLTKIRGTDDLPMAYQVWMSKHGLINRFVKPQDKGELISSDDFIRLELDENSAVFLLLAVIMAHNFEQTVFDPEVIGQGLQLIQPDRGDDTHGETGDGDLDGEAIPGAAADIQHQPQQDGDKGRQAERQQLERQQVEKRTQVGDEQARERAALQIVGQQGRLRAQVQSDDAKERADIQRRREVQRPVAEQDGEAKKERMIGELMEMGLDALQLVRNERSDDPRRTGYRRQVAGILRSIGDNKERNLLLKEALHRLRLQ